MVRRLPLEAIMKARHGNLTRPSSPATCGTPGHLMETSPGQLSIRRDAAPGPTTNDGCVTLGRCSFCVSSWFIFILKAINDTGFVYELPSISDPPTEVTRTTTSVTITWRPWDEETDIGDPPVVAYIPYYKMDPSQDWMSGSSIQADQTLEYPASSLESDRNYTFSVAAVRKGEGGEGPRGPPVTIKTLCIDVVPQMVTTTLTATNDVAVTWQQPTVQCSTGITQFTIYYEIEGDVSTRQEAGTADPSAESFTVDGSLLESGTTYIIAVTVTTDQESALSEGRTVTGASNIESEPPSSPVYLVALVIPFLLIVILLVVIIKRIRRKPATESKPVDSQDVDYVNAGVTDGPEDYIALEEQSRITPAQKYQDLTEKEAPTQVSRYERTILETADAHPRLCLVRVLRDRQTTNMRMSTSEKQMLGNYQAFSARPAM
ncbi:putative tyrosine-protein kinase [Apostichopus japonicus]|uniref:Putative tyrosine-protein kinase n=1 Tax=Stichopus japonicus TaxID=307972 RepID=A0A2G8LEP9_STIJA|nr:putative tyrosine-protein kinase [Apostichopus japonicus]